MEKDQRFDFSSYWEDQVEKIKSHCKDLSKLSLPKDKDDLILEIAGSDKIWSGILKKIDYNNNHHKIGEILYSYAFGSFFETQ